MGKATIIKGVDVPLQTYKKGDRIFSEGDPGDFFYIIKQGEVSVFKSVEGNDKMEIARVGAGQVLGEVAVIDGNPRSATAVTLTPVTLVKVHKSTILHQMENSPSWFRAIVLGLVHRLRNSGELLKKAGVKDHNVVSSLKNTHDGE